MPFRPSDSLSKFTRSTRTKASRFVDRFSELVSSASEAAHQQGVRWGLDIETIDYGSAENSARSFYRRMSSLSRQQLEDVSQFTPTPTKAPLSAIPSSTCDEKYGEYEVEHEVEADEKEERQAFQESKSLLDPRAHPWDLETPVESVDPGGTSMYDADWGGESRFGRSAEDEVPRSAGDTLDEEEEYWLLPTSSQASSSVHSHASNGLQEVDTNFGVSSLASSFNDSASSQSDEAPSSPFFAPSAPQESQFIFPDPQTIPPNSSQSHGGDPLSQPPSV